MTESDSANVVTRCGYVAIVGRPNVGKSTLLNHLLGQKISITSRKPQTTRHNVLGILTQNNTQTIFVDTPGQHRGRGKALNRYLNKAATSAMQDVDVLVFVLEKLQWTDEDQNIADRICEQLQTGQTLLVVVNKIDQLQHKHQLMPHLQFLAQKLPRAELVPVSALKNDNLDHLLSLINNALPEAPFHFDEDQVTDRSVRFLTAEIIREKLTRQLGDELPYAISVAIERFEQRDATTFIDAIIWVEREGQKTILIGDQGSRMKSVGEQARPDIEALIQHKVMLSLWVKVKSGWSDDERALRSLGYDELGD